MRSSTSRSPSNGRSRRPPLTGSIRLDPTFGSSADPKRRRRCGLDLLREHVYAADRATALLTHDDAGVTVRPTVLRREG